VSEGQLFVIRIVGLQRNESVGQEFVLLQNQGSLRLNLRGHLVVSEAALDEGDLTQAAHAFNDDVLIPPGMYVLLFTGAGLSRWARTRDGALVYYSFMNRANSVWDCSTGPLHLLCTQHTFCERPPALLLR